LNNYWKQKIIIMETDFYCNRSTYTSHSIINGSICKAKILNGSQYKQDKVRKPDQ